VGEHAEQVGGVLRRRFIEEGFSCAANSFLIKDENLALALTSAGRLFERCNHARENIEMKPETSMLGEAAG